MNLHRLLRRLHHFFGDAGHEIAYALSHRILGPLPGSVLFVVPHSFLLSEPADAARRDRSPAITKQPLPPQLNVEGNVKAPSQRKLLITRLLGGEASASRFLCLDCNPLQSYAAYFFT